MNIMIKIFYLIITCIVFIFVFRELYKDWLKRLRFRDIIENGKNNIEITVSDIFSLCFHMLVSVFMSILWLPIGIVLIGLLVCFLIIRLIEKFLKLDKIIIKKLNKNTLM